MAKMLNVTEQHMSKLGREGIVPRSKNGEWDVDAVVRAYVTWRLDHLTEGAKADKARKEKADADIAETKSAKLDDVLVFKDDYVNNYADAIAQGVSRISRLKNLTTAQKESVFAELRAVKLADLASDSREDENEDDDEAADEN